MAAQQAQRVQYRGSGRLYVGGGWPGPASWGAARVQDPSRAWSKGKESGAHTSRPSARRRLRPYGPPYGRWHVCHCQKVGGTPSGTRTWCSARQRRAHSACRRVCRGSVCPAQCCGAPAAAKNSRAARAEETLTGAALTGALPGGSRAALGAEARGAPHPPTTTSSSAIVWFTLFERCGSAC